MNKPTDFTFNAFAAKAAETAIYPMVWMDDPAAYEAGTIQCSYIYPALGLAGEAGEVAEKIKKIIRDKNGVMDAGDRAALSKEIGDVLWYCAALCKEIGVSLEQAALDNGAKLSARKAAGVLQGSGDNR